MDGGIGKRTHISKRAAAQQGAQGQLGEANSASLDVFHGVLHVVLVGCVVTRLRALLLRAHASPPISCARRGRAARAASRLRHGSLRSTPSPTLAPTDPVPRAYCPFGRELAPGHRVGRR